MDEPDVIEKAAQRAEVEPEQAKRVLEAAEEERSNGALRRARTALEPPPDADRTGFFPSFRRKQR